MEEAIDVPSFDFNQILHFDKLPTSEQSKFLTWISEQSLSYLSLILDSEKNNLLHYAVRTNNSKLVWILIEKGISMLQENYLGVTSFEMATRNSLFSQFLQKFKPSELLLNLIFIFFFFLFF
jgi:hypothetical protein